MARTITIELGNATDEYCCDCSHKSITKCDISKEDLKSELYNYNYELKRCQQCIDAERSK